MDIKQNIVCIKTGTQMGSGIIYPCEVEASEFVKSSFIIFTNRHLVKGLPKDDAHLMFTVDFDIYDKHGSKIEIPKDPKKAELKLFYVAHNDIGRKRNDQIEDIAAFLLTFHNKIEIDLEQKILFHDDDLNDIFIEGFPQVLQDDKISSKIQLKGIYKPIFPKNNKIGIFQIKDDYHWYSNYKDLRLFQGFSGGPIYKNEGQENYLVGMNQSISNVADGENPFKLVYYYKFHYILEYLREQGCLIFKKNKDKSIAIKWIFGIDKKDMKKDISLLLLGASGAGKSSFAKTFLLHANFIDSTNDGQTTRSNILYHIALLEEKPRAEIKFLDKEQFLHRMEQINYANFLLKIMSFIYPKANANTLEDYLKYICNKAEEVKTEELRDLKEELEKVEESEILKLYKQLKKLEKLKKIKELEELKEKILRILLASKKIDFKEQEKDKENLYNVIEEIIENRLKQNPNFILVHHQFTRKNKSRKRSNAV